MAQLELLLNPAEWMDYRSRHSRLLSVPDTNEQWGLGPNTYPCLAATVKAGFNKLATCFMFPQDAVTLLASAVNADPTPLPAVAKQKAEAVEAASLKTFAAAVNAHLLAIIQVMVDTSLVSEKQYEALYNQKLSFVDQADAQFKDAIGLRHDGKDQDCEGK